MASGPLSRLVEAQGSCTPGPEGQWQGFLRAYPAYCLRRAPTGGRAARPCYPDRVFPSGRQEAADGQPARMTPRRPRGRGTP